MQKLELVQKDAFEITWPSRAPSSPFILLCGRQSELLLNSHCPPPCRQGSGFPQGGPFPVPGINPHMSSPFLVVLFSLPRGLFPTRCDSLRLVISKRSGRGEGMASKKGPLILKKETPKKWTSFWLWMFLGLDGKLRTTVLILLPENNAAKIQKRTKWRGS